MEEKLLKRLREMGCLCIKPTDITQLGSLVTFKCGRCKIAIRSKDFQEYLDELKKNELSDNKENEY